MMTNQKDPLKELFESWDQIFSNQIQLGKMSPAELIKDIEQGTTFCNGIKCLEKVGSGEECI